MPQRAAALSCIFDGMHWRDWKHPAKTALASAVALLAYESLHLKHGYWAVISAIIVMQSNLGGSLRASGNRLIGTAIGAMVGSAVFWAGGRNAVSLFVAVALTLWICVITGLQGSMRLAAVTVAIVMLIGEASPWHAGVNRFIDVALGVVIAVLVSLAWPSRAGHELRRSLAQTYTELRQLFAQVTACGMGGDCNGDAIERGKQAATARAQRNASLLADAQREPVSCDESLLALTASAARIRDHIYGIDYAARPMAHDSLPGMLAPQLRVLFDYIERAFEDIAAELRGGPRLATPGLSEALDQLEKNFGNVRQSGATLQFRTDELLRFYSLLYRLRQLAGELDRDGNQRDTLSPAA